MLITVLDSSSMEAAVCCRLLACSSVRCDRSALPIEIWLEPVAMLSLLPRTELTTFNKEACMVLMASITLPGLALLVSMAVVRSPAAMAVAAAATSKGSPPS